MMNNIWTKEDIEKILIRLNELDLPFKGYSFDAFNGGLVLLGKGSSAYVFRAHRNKKIKRHYAVKVIGFNGNRPADETFETAIKTQDDLYSKCFNIVRIYEHSGVIIKIEGDNTVVSAREIIDGAEPATEDNELYIRFILMEEVLPVVSREGTGRIRLNIDKLNYDVQEILKLAYDIGTALNEAHKMNTLHRDIKLENIFYSPEDDNYKLGDFGIAKRSADLQADTKAFTKGYGAPEVILAPEDKYDNTADIYSFGITLYVLLNNCRFPDSRNYYPNLSVQYSSGYIPPAPSMGNEELNSMVIKMCSFDPDKRYQSVEELLIELDKLLYGMHLKFVRKHRSAAAAMGFVTWLLGAFVSRLSFWQSQDITVTAALVILLILVTGRFAFSVRKKPKNILNLSILILGTYCLVKYGFSWGRLAALILAVLLDEVAGWLSSGAIMFILAAKFGEYYPISNASGLKWIGITLLSLSVFLIIQYVVSMVRNRTITAVYTKRNYIWLSAALAYTALLLHWNLAVTAPERAEFLYSWLFGNGVSQWIIENRFDLVGLSGMIFCLVWNGREMVIRSVERIRENRRIKM